ncbi:MAG: hypothetical protein AB1571_00530 [Nanoarchaeota archaeon]
MKRLCLIVLISIFLGGCAQQIEPKEQVVSKCIELCNSKLDTQDLNNGPCLGLIANDWVCDVAHNPRQAVDNIQENQCSEFREGKAKHFIEVDPKCELIRAV